MNLLNIEVLNTKFSICWFHFWIIICCSDCGLIPQVKIFIHEMLTQFFALNYIQILLLAIHFLLYVFIVLVGGCNFNNLCFGWIHMFFIYCHLMINMFFVLSDILIFPHINDYQFNICYCSNMHFP
jgi:hypothetical protein